MIDRVHRRHPDVLSSRSVHTAKADRYLAKVGFTQSYTYFPWELQGE